MNILSLATRGYLSQAGEIRVVMGAGPPIVASEVSTPQVVAGRGTIRAGPKIQGSSASSPSISGGSRKATTGTKPPSISGSGKPKIK